MMDHLPKPVLIGAAAIAIFVLLVGARTIIEAPKANAIDPASYYTELGQELRNSSILPFDKDDSTLLAFANSTIRKDLIREPYQEKTGYYIIELGNLFKAKSQNGIVEELEISVRHLKEIKPGSLQAAIRNISKLDIDQQSIKKPGQPQLGHLKHFSFVIKIGNKNYTFVPTFNGKTCEKITVREK